MKCNVAEKTGVYASVFFCKSLLKSKTKCFNMYVVYIMGVSRECVDFTRANDTDVKVVLWSCLCFYVIVVVCVVSI